jgi:hypothetical protein
MKYANDANERFKRTLTAQALGITWIGYNGASSSRCWAARRQHGRSPRVPVIGLLDQRSPGELADRLRGFHQGLKEAGFR